MLTAHSLPAALAAAGWDGPVHFLPRTESTNDDARALAQAGAPSGTLLVAGEQTAGRGRAGRRWHSPGGSSLALSLLLRPDRVPAPGALALLAGLAAAEAAEDLTGVPAQLKWPNDVLLRGRKACGLLVETAWQGARLEYAIIGIGVNVGAGAVPPPQALDFPATSLEEEAGRRVGRLETAAALVRRLGAWLPRAGEAALVEAWGARLAFRGEAVTVETAQGPLAGVLVGVTPEGHLLLRLAAGQVQPVLAGERLRPAGN